MNAALVFCLAACGLMMMMMPSTDAYKEDPLCKKRICTKQYLPVCGSDGVTYGNDCMRRVANCDRRPGDRIRKVYDGPCTETTTSRYPSTDPYKDPVCKSRICTEQYDPVCGSDGVTYGNECFLRVANCDRRPGDQIRKVYDGPCTETTTPRKCPEVCILLYAPVCGSDNKTYNNTCFLGIHNCNNPCCPVTVQYQGECGKSTQYPAA